MKLKDEFISKYKELLNDEFESFIEGFNRQRSYGLRLNTLKCTTYQNIPFLNHNLTPIPLVPNGFYYDVNLHPGRHPYHHAGVYYIQDPSAMMVIENADIKENDVVFDMSAAPGGKSTHILSKLNNTGLLITNDINHKRAKILSENIERMGATNALVLSCDPLKLNPEFDGYFDKVIIDAPCSGEGMFRKDELSALDWSMEKVNSCSIIQKSLLNKAYELVKENGLIIYSTCTFSKEENEDNIQYLLNQYKDLILLPTIKNDSIASGLGNLEACSRFYFHKYQGEGHFIAKLKKTSTSYSIKKTKSKSLKKATTEQLKYLRQFIDEYLTDFTLDYPVYDFNQHLYMFTYDGVMPNIDHLSIIRFGLHLGEIKKNRFEPSHALALALKPHQVNLVINFSSDSDEIIKYLSGETISYPGHHHFSLVTVDGFSIGWVKQVNHVLKNYYPKGLRIKK